MNRSIDDHHVNISNFLNNECMTWYQIYITSFFGGRDADIIDFR